MSLWLACQEKADDMQMTDSWFTSVIDMSLWLACHEKADDMQMIDSWFTSVIDMSLWLACQEKADDMQMIDSCEYIWESGVGFAHSPAKNVIYDQNRTEILKLLMTCFSETMYLPPVGESRN